MPPSICVLYITTSYLVSLNLQAHNPSPTLLSPSLVLSRSPPHLHSHSVSVHFVITLRLISQHSLFLCTLRHLPAPRRVKSHSVINRLQPHILHCPVPHPGSKHTLHALQKISFRLPFYPAFYYASHAHLTVNFISCLFFLSVCHSPFPSVCLGPFPLSSFTLPCPVPLIHLVIFPFSVSYLPRC